MSRRPVILTDEPLTFDVEATNPLSGWIDAATTRICTGAALPFPPPSRKVSKAEGAAAFLKVLSLTGRISQHQTLSVWQDIWANWSPEWGTSQEKGVGGKSFIEHFTGVERRKHTALPYALLAWLQQERLEGPGHYLWPTTTCLSPWSDAAGHWCYQALLSWHQAFSAIPPRSVSDSEKKQIAASRHAWSEAMDFIDHRLHGVEAGLQWPSHWRILYAQERPLFDVSAPLPVPDTPPIDRPEIVVGGYADQSAWTSMKRHWSNRILRACRLNRPQEIEQLMESGRPYLFFDQDAPGDKQVLGKMSNDLGKFPIQKAMWEKMLLEETLRRAAPVQDHTPRVRRRL